jgi:hypothetical protein
MILKTTQSSSTSLRTRLLGIVLCLSLPVQWAFLLPEAAIPLHLKERCFHGIHPRRDRAQRQLSLSSLHSTCNGNNSSSITATNSIIYTLRTSDRFDRWKFLQDFLDDSLDDNNGDAEQVLFAVLQGYPLEGDTIGIPTATPEQKRIVQDLLDKAAPNGMIPVFSDLETLRKVEALIPDPQEDQDGFKSAWDTVLEIHGRESVKVNEEAATERWKALSIVGRVLLHYEFLTEGIQGA